MKALLKGLTLCFIFSLILNSIECQASVGGGAGNTSTTDSVTSDNTTDSGSPSNASQPIGTQDINSTEIITSSGDTNSSSTTEDPNSVVDTNTGDGGDLGGSPPIHGEETITSGPVITVPENTDSVPPDFDGSLTSVSPKGPYNWLPLILITMVFTCCAILGTVWAIMKTRAKKGDAADGHEETQINDTVHKDDKPDDAPAVKSGDSPPPTPPPTPPSDTPRSSIVEPIKSGVEPSVREENSVKSESEKMSQTSAEPSATASVKSDSGIEGQSDMGSAISSSGSDVGKTVQLKEPNSVVSSQTSPTPDSAINSSAESGTDATKSKESL